jgi:hypothetical protein
MKVIRFRGKVLDSGEWVYGSFLEQDSNTEGVIVGDFGPPVRVDRQSVGQYSGRKDDDARELYAGDIVLYTRYNWRCSGHTMNGKDLAEKALIVWDEERHGFGLELYDKGGHYASGPLSFEDRRAEKIGVKWLGNITDNADMLPGRGE